MTRLGRNLAKGEVLEMTVPATVTQNGTLTAWFGVLIESGAFPYSLVSRTTAPAVKELADFDYVRGNQHELLNEFVHMENATVNDWLFKLVPPTS